MPTFFDLPPEIRVNIYSYIVVEDHPFQILTRPGPYRVRAQRIDVPEPDLLAVCKLIRKEAMPIFYGANIFEPLFGNSYLDTAEFVAWLPDEKVNMLRALRSRQDPTQLSTWQGYSLAEAREDGNSILGMGRGLLRRDAILLPFLEMETGQTAWCTFDELEDFEEVREIGKGYVEGLREIEKCYWRKKDGINTQSMW